MAINKLSKIASDTGGVKTPKPSKITVTQTNKRTITPTKNIKSEAIQVNNQETVVNNNVIKPVSEPSNSKIIKVSPKDPSSITMKLEVPELLKDDRALKLADIADNSVKMNNTLPTKSSPTIVGIWDIERPTVIKDRLSNDKVISFLEADGNTEG